LCDEIPPPLSWTSIDSKPWFLKRTSTKCQRDYATMIMLHTNAGGTGIETILHQFLDHRAQINNDLTGLDLMYLLSIRTVLTKMRNMASYSPAFNRFYGGHGMIDIADVEI
jgi:hypothetical protein